MNVSFHQPILARFGAQDGSHHHRGVTRSREAQTSASASLTTAAELTVETAEGDTVVISVESVLESEFAGYRYRARGAGRRADVSAVNAQSNAQRTVTASVEGDLNAQEIGDIQKLAKLLIGATQEQREGDMAGVIRALGGFSALDSLASADFSFDQSYEYETESSFRRARYGHRQHRC